MSNKLHTGTAALNAITNWPESVFGYQAKKDEKKGKCQFVNLKWAIDSKTSRTEGWFKFENATLFRGITAHEDTKPGSSENEYETSRLQLRVKLSELGDLGQFLELAEPQWQAFVDKLDEDKVITRGKRDTHTFVQLEHSMEHTMEELRGQPIDDPVVKFKIDFSRYEKFAPAPLIKGSQKTTIYDATKTYIDSNNKQQYKVATVTNGAGVEEELNADNVHKFLRKNSTISGIIHISCLCVSQSWVSIPITASKLYVVPGLDDNFDGDVMAPAGAVTLSNIPLADKKEPVEVIVPTEVADIQPANDNDINDLLNTLK